MSTRMMSAPAAIASSTCSRLWASTSIGISGLLGAPVFRRLATVGYGVYLVHIPLIDHLIVPAAHELEDREVSMWFVWPASLLVVTLLSFVIGYVMHVLIEKPSLRFREMLAA